MNKHKFFNTNNLLVNLEALKATFTKFGGAMPLPVIKNGKTVDPRDKKSTKVLQLETAMGSAIECFDGAKVREGRLVAQHARRSARPACRPLLAAAVPTGC